jgi:hypothetical protein
MRLFEAVLIVLGGQLALAAAVMGGRSPKRAGLLPLILLAPLAAHLALEGARWQMVPAYLVAAGFCVVGTIRHVRGGPVRPWPALNAAGIAGFVLLMLSAAAVAFFR